MKKVIVVLILFISVFTSKNVSAQCPPFAAFDGFDTLNNPITFPYTTNCNDDQWYSLIAWDSIRVGTFIVPAYILKVNPTNANTNNEVYLFQGGNYFGGFYPGSPSGSIPANTNMDFYIEYMSPSAGTEEIRMCDPTSGANMPYVVYDAASNAIIAGPGTWTATDAGTGGPGGSTCQTVSFPASSITGIANYTCPSCPAGSFYSGDWGGAWFNPSAAGPGTYNITYTWNDQQGCVVTTTNTIIVTSPYDATFNYSAATYCQTATDPTPSVVQSGGIFSSTSGLVISPSTGTIDLSISTPGTYTVQYSVGTSPCNATYTQSITIVAPPNAGTNGSVTACSSGGTLNLFNYLGGSPDAGGTWTDPNGNSHTGVLDPTTDPAGVYTYSVAGTAPCSGASATVTVSITNQPNAGTNGTATFCSSDPSVALSTLLGGSPDAGGTWTDPNGNPHSGTLNPATDVSGTYTYTIPSSGSCAGASATVAITISPLPTVTVSGNNTICQGDSLPLTATIGGSASSVTWTTSGDGLFTSAVTPSTIYVPGTNDLSSGVFTITATTDDPTGPCPSVTENITVTLNPSPNVNAGIDDTLTCLINNITLNGTVTPVSNYTYTWTTPDGNIVSGAATDTPTVDQSGMYIFTVIDNTTGCMDTDTVNIASETSATVAIGVNPTSGTAPLTVNASASGSSGSYSWDFGDGTTGTGTSLTHIYENTGTYTIVVTVTTPSGCTASDSVIIEVVGESSLIFPTTFTPNGDGVNDVFHFKAVNIVSLECTIFNRWGQIMYSWKTPNGYWDGYTTAGIEASEGTYFYIMKAKGEDGQEYERKGTFTLLR